MNKPREFDAVLGGNNPPPKDAAVIGGELRWSRHKRTIKLPDSDAAIQTPLFDNEAIAILQTLDNDFARSLFDCYQKRGSLSCKQWFYAHKLVLDNYRYREVNQISNASLTQVYAYVSSFKSKAFEVFNDDGNGIRFYKTSTSKGRNKVQITTSASSSPSKLWCGRIERMEDDNFVNFPDLKVDLVNLSRLNSDFIQQLDAITCKLFISNKIPDWAYSLLIDFLQHPAKVAARSGKVTGRCCFCGLPLTDARSLSVGYGPICARKYGLKWGSIDTDDDVDGDVDNDTANGGADGGDSNANSEDFNTDVDYDADDIDVGDIVSFSDDFDLD